MYSVGRRVAFVRLLRAEPGVSGLCFWQRHKSLSAKIIGATLAIFRSVTFYVMANTLAWWSYSSARPWIRSPTPLDFAGWWQANTVGLPGWQPTWTFLRNGLLGDLFFCGVLVAIFDHAVECSSSVCARASKLVAA